MWAYLLPLIKNFAHWRQKVPSGSNSVGMCGKKSASRMHGFEKGLLIGCIIAPAVQRCC